MSDIVKAVRDKVGEDNLAKYCREKQCSVHIESNLKPYILIQRDRDIPRSSAQDNRCDFILLSDPKKTGKSKKNTCWIAPIELKSGRIDEDEDKMSLVIRQLQAGSKYAENVIMPVIVDRVKVMLRPIVAHGAKAHTTRQIMRKLKKNPIYFRGKSIYITVIKCGSTITKKTLQGGS